QQLRTGRRSGLVFSRDGRTPFDGDWAHRQARAAWEKAALEPIGLHEARHAFASLMIAAGVNAKALSTYMGHASVTITLDRYGYLMPGTRAPVLICSTLTSRSRTQRLASLRSPTKRDWRNAVTEGRWLARWRRPLVQRPSRRQKRLTNERRTRPQRQPGWFQTEPPAEEVPSGRGRPRCDPKG